MYKYQIGPIASLLLFSLLSFPANASPAWNPSGFWTGHLSYRDADLPLRVEIQKAAGTWQAGLDIPSLVYARQAIAIEEVETGVFTLEFPFGIGVISLQPKGPEKISGYRDGFSLTLALTKKPKTQQIVIRFGAVDPGLEGTLHLPNGSGPFPVAVLVAGSGNANRQSWSYASWVDFYLENGMGAFIYDRRPDNQSLPGGAIAVIDDHARDVSNAIQILRTLENVDGNRIGVVGASRGAWIAMAVNDHVPDLAFILLSSAAAATPAEQEVSSILAGMDQDGLSSKDIAAARSYLRLYFYVAQTSFAWELLRAAIKNGAGSNWLPYVDQPRTLDDLLWWQANMNFDAVSHLRRIQAPILAIWGGADFITPWAEYREKLLIALEIAGNQSVVTRVFENADHRIEIGFGEDADGAWHWFGIAPGALDEIEKWFKQIL